MSMAVLRIADGGTGGNDLATARRMLGVSNYGFDIVADWGADPTGATDNTTLVNTKSAALSAAGGGVVLIPPGAYKMSLILRPNVRFIGAGQSSNIIAPSSALPCVTQDSTQSLAHAGLNYVRLTASAATDTAISLSSIQASEIGNIWFSGFTAGTLLSIVGAHPAVISDASLGANIIFNVFHDFDGFTGSAKAVVIAGRYSDNAAPSPIGANGMVATQNSFRDFNLAFSDTGIDVKFCADTNIFTNIYLRATANNGRFVVQGDDAAYAGQNVYVDANFFFGLTFSRSANEPAGLVGFAGDFSFGTQAYGLSSDVPYANFTLNGMTNDNGHIFIGTGIDTALSSSLAVVNDSFNVARHKNTLIVTPGSGFVIPSTASSGAFTTGYDLVVLNNQTQLAAGQVQFPRNAQDGDEFALISVGGVLSFTLNVSPGSGEHILILLTAVAAGVVYRYRFYKGAGVGNSYWTPR